MLSWTNNFFLKLPNVLVFFMQQVSSVKIHQDASGVDLWCQNHITCNIQNVFQNRQSEVDQTISRDTKGQKPCLKLHLSCVVLMYIDWDEMTGQVLQKVSSFVWKDIWKYSFSFVNCSTMLRIWINTKINVASILICRRGKLMRPRAALLCLRDAFSTMSNICRGSSLRK